jgi:hypothetical protein
MILCGEQPCGDFCDKVEHVRVAKGHILVHHDFALHASCTAKREHQNNASLLKSPTPPPDSWRRPLVLNATLRTFIAQAPWIRSFLVRARVSTPYIPGTLFSLSHCARKSECEPSSTEESAKENKGSKREVCERRCSSIPHLRQRLSRIPVRWNMAIILADYGRHLM